MEAVHLVWNLSLLTRWTRISGLAVLSTEDSIGMRLTRSTRRSYLHELHNHGNDGFEVTSALQEVGFAAGWNWIGNGRIYNSASPAMRTTSKSNLRRVGRCTYNGSHKTFEAQSKGLSNLRWLLRNCSWKNLTLSSVYRWGYMGLCVSICTNFLWWKPPSRDFAPSFASDLRTILIPELPENSSLIHN